eukprot:gene14079-biopygen15640
MAGTPRCQSDGVWMPGLCVCWGCFSIHALFAVWYRIRPPVSRLVLLSAVAPVRLFGGLWIVLLLLRFVVLDVRISPLVGPSPRRVGPVSS